MASLSMLRSSFGPRTQDPPFQTSVPRPMTSRRRTHGVELGSARFTAREKPEMWMPKCNGNSLSWNTDPHKWTEPWCIDPWAAPHVVSRYPKAKGCIAFAGGNSAKLKQIPWRSLVEEVMQGSPAYGLSTISELTTYLAKWRSESVAQGEVESVDALIRWELHQPKELCNVCRIGSWLGDSVHTEILVRDFGARSNIEYQAIGNDVYARLSKALNITHAYFRSENNQGNILEQMMWLAFESGRYQWIVGVVRWCIIDKRDHKTSPTEQPKSARQPAKPPQPATCTYSDGNLQSPRSDSSNATTVSTVCSDISVATLLSHEREALTPPVWLPLMGVFYRWGSEFVC